MFNLSEALDAIKNKSEFKYNIRDGYSVIDYFLSLPGTFLGKNDRETLILKNLRGTCFDQDGLICSLALDKFHNLGECDGWRVEDIDFTQKFSVLEKKDGSMIRMIPIGEGYRLGTRAGITEYSDMAERFVKNSSLKDSYEAFFLKCLKDNTTPIFEYTSRENQVVIDYPVAALTLLAVRNNISGSYCNYNERSYCNYNELELYTSGLIPIVKEVLDNTSTIQEIAAAVKLWDDSEGVVITFDSGFRVKIKADQYVLLHRSIDVIQHEKNVLELILTNKLDDLLPLVSEDRKMRLVNYEKSVRNSISKHILEIEDLYKSQSFQTDKEFAMWAKQNSLYTRFLLLRHKKGVSGFLEYLIKNCSTGTTVEFIRHFIGPSFKEF
jgi:T4 RnlA family RNA ligase